MKTLKNTKVMVTANLLIFCIFSSCLLSACGKKTATENPSSPQEVAELTMESLKNLDLAAFNQYTDNYVQTHYNLLGGAEVEYRTFNELLQCRSKRGKRYQSAYNLSQKMMENLSWEITDVREHDNTAEIDMVITNADINKALGNYEVKIMENMLNSQGSGLGQLMTDMSELITDKETLISMIDSLDDKDIVTFDVTVSAYQEDGQWNIHLSRDFINAFSGNIYDENYSENTAQRITELEEQYETKIDEWAESFESRFESKIENKIGNWTQNFD